MIDARGLSLAVQEANALSGKAVLNKQEERRYSFLLSAISAIKAGATLEQLEQDNFNDHARQNGLPVARFENGSMTAREQRATIREWQRFVNHEQRDNEGAILPQVGTYTALGHFVPTTFFKDVKAALAAHDPIFDENSCTVLNTTNGRPIELPIYGDIESVAVAVGEAQTQSAANISAPGHALLGAYAYKTPQWSCSIEAFQDMGLTLSTVGLFKQFASDRLRRGMSKDLLVGNGTNVPLGLVTALENLGVQFITAAGSSENTGGPETGASSIGSADLSNLYYSVNSAYRESDKCAFWMNDSTLNYIDGLVTKLGLPLGLVKWDSGKPLIMGKPVKIANSMQSLGSSNVVVLFGDFSYQITRLVTGTDTDESLAYIQTFSQAPGYAENGLIGLRAFMRCDGVLAFNDTGSPAPINALRCHS